MQQPAPESPPFDALSDAIARIDGSGALLACNASMRDLLDALQVSNIEDIPLADGGIHEFRVVEEEGSRWLLATDRSGEIAARLSAMRLRTLGNLAGTIVHDLANMLLVGVAVAETVRPFVRDQNEAQALDELQEGARRGTVMGRALASQLQRSPREWSVVPVGRLTEEVMVIVGKHAGQRGIEMSTGGDCADSVRVQIDEATQALMHGALYCIERGAARIGLSTMSRQAPLASGRVRPEACVRVTASSLEPSTASLAGEVLVDDSRLLEVLGRAPIDASGLALARIALLRVGGELQASGDDAEFVLDYAWPAIS